MVLLVSGAAAVAAVFVFWPTEEPHAISAAFAHVDETWPPPPEELVSQAATTQALGTLMEYGMVPEGGLEGLDAGLFSLAGDTGAMHVRVGYEEDLFFLECVLGEEASFEDPMPMALLIHGRGDRARLPGGPFWNLGAPLRVIVPQAPDPLGDGYEWLPVRVGSGLIDRLTTSLMSRAGQLARLVRTVQRSRPTAGEPLVVGFSQGGLLTFTLATHFSDVVSAAFPLSAWLPPALVPPYRRQDVAYPPIRGVHGEADTVVPYPGNAEVFALLEERGFDVELVTFPGVGHTMNEEMNRQLRTWLQQAVGARVDEAVRAGVMDGGPPPPPPPCPADLPDGAPPPSGCVFRCPDPEEVERSSSAVGEAGAPAPLGPDGGPCLAPCPPPRLAGALPDGGVANGGLGDGGLCLRRPPAPSDAGTALQLDTSTVR